MCARRLPSTPGGGCRPVIWWRRCRRPQPSSERCWFVDECGGCCAWRGDRAADLGSHGVVEAGGGRPPGDAPSGGVNGVAVVGAGEVVCVVQRPRVGGAGGSAAVERLFVVDVP